MRVSGRKALRSRCLATGYRFSGAKGGVDAEHANRGCALGAPVQRKAAARRLRSKAHALGLEDIEANVCAKACLAACLATTDGAAPSV